MADLPASGCPCKRGVTTTRGDWGLTLEVVYAFPAEGALLEFYARLVPEPVDYALEFGCHVYVWA